MRPVATAAVRIAIPMQNGLSQDRFWICLAARTISTGRRYSENKVTRLDGYIMGPVPECYKGAFREAARAVR